MKRPRGDECPHAPGCVPCPLRGRPYREQLAWKQRAVVDAFREHPRLGGVEVEDVVGSRDLFGYRNVAKLAVRSRSGGGLRAGVYEPGSHRLAEASGCPAHHPTINAVMARTLEEGSRIGISAYDERTGEGELRYLVARYSASTRRVLLILVTARGDTSPIRELSRRLSRRTAGLGGIVLNVNAEPGNVILGRRWATLRPPAGIEERIGFLRLHASPGAFLQANLWTARRIYETALEWAAPESGNRAIDLYCGVGPLSLYLATRAARVEGIEEIAEAARDARSNARRNGFHNARFEAGDAEALLPAAAARMGGVEIVTLNPPRKGTRAGLLDAIDALGPKRVVYVSCNPATLARDLDRLASHGFRITRVRPFDMLPQTEHVEVVALAERDGLSAPARTRA